MSDFREIFVKAVCGRSRHAFHDTNILKTGNALDEVLGCKVTNHRYAAIVSPAGVKINGSYDIHIWHTHSGGNDTNVLTKTIDYTRAVSFEELGMDPYTFDNPEATVRITHGPIVSDAAIAGGSSVKIIVDIGYLIEVVGDTRLCVKHYPGACDDQLKKEFFASLEDEDLEEEFEDEFVEDDMIETP